MSILFAFFTLNGTPKTGLSPTIDIWEDDGTVTVNDGAMTEVAGGWYKYDFSAIDDTKNYVFVADGTTTLIGNERYVSGTNELSPLSEVNAIQKNRLVIDDTVLKIYKDDGTTVKLSWDLKDRDGAATDTDVFQREPL